MKKLALLLFAAFAVGNVSAQNWVVPTTHRTMILKFTADWCGPCGSWGWTQTTSLISGTPNALTLAFHESSSTTTTLNVGSTFGTAMESNLDLAVSGIPSFIVGNKNLEQASTAACQAAVATATATPAVANAGFVAKWNGDSLIVDTRTKFFSATTGDYYVAVYALEEGIVAYQNGQGATATHHNVFRVPLGAPQWGVKLTGTSFTATSQQDVTFRMKAQPSWNKSNIHVFTVIWKKNGTKYDVMNVNELKTFATSVQNVNEAMVDASVYPNPATNSFTVNLNNNVTKATISLTDITGKHVAEVYNGNVTNGTININRPSELANGIYFLNINSDKGAKTIKVSLQ